MSNSYFRFKQFTIEQGLCAMKVTTDACIQGAWTPIDAGVKRVLDVGAGTGLLALMLAQRDPNIFIDALELDEQTAKQACDNFYHSGWGERLSVVTGDARNFSSTCKYDLIITNPPFFNNSLASDDPKKILARHNLSLGYDELLKVMDDNLEESGYVSILLPHPEYLLFSSLSKKTGWHETARLSVMHRPGADVKRVVGIWSKKKSALVEQTLIIRGNGESYSEEFSALLAPFYLAL